MKPIDLAKDTAVLMLSQRSWDLDWIVRLARVYIDCAASGCFLYKTINCPMNSGMWIYKI